VTVKQQRGANRVEANEEETGVPAPNSLDGSADGSMDGALSGATGRSRRRLNTGTLILAGVILVSGASLWSMRAVDRAAASGPRISKEDEEILKEALTPRKPGASANADPRAFVDRTEPPVDLQVPAEQVPKNPFVIYAEPKTEVEVAALTEAPTAPKVDRVSEWQAKVDEAASTIVLQSTMSGTDLKKGLVGIANINGEMLRLGDVFGVDGSDVEFRLEHVERDSIIVRAYNSELKHERLVTVQVQKRY
jgi:hypothetical protein